MGTFALPSSRGGNKIISVEGGRSTCVHYSGHVLLICLQLTVGKMRHLAVRVRGIVMLRVQAANYYTLPSCLDHKKQC